LPVLSAERAVCPLAIIENEHSRGNARRASTKRELTRRTSDRLALGLTTNRG
jgi:hypothetical protein